MFPVEHPLMFLYRDSFGSPACPVMRLTSTLEAKLLNQGYRYRKHCKAFSRFYRRHFDLMSEFNVGFKALLQQGLSELAFYGDLVQIIFHFLWDHWAHCGIFENGVLLMYTLEGVSSVANFITAYEESQ